MQKNNNDSDLLAVYKRLLTEGYDSSSNYHDDDGDKQELLGPLSTKSMQKEETPRRNRTTNLIQTGNLPNIAFPHGHAVILSLLCIGLILASLLNIGARTTITTNTSLVSDLLMWNKSNDNTDNFVPLLSFEDHLGLNDQEIRNQAYNGSEAKPKNDDSEIQEKQQPKDHADINIGDTFNDGYDCIGKEKRLKNNTQLKTGEYICSADGRYAFGINDQGDLIWRDRIGNKTKTFYKGRKGFAFTLKSNGEFFIYNEKKEIKWNKKCRISSNWAKDCRSRYDCPFLHLHLGGVVVLNFVDDAGEKRQANIIRAYGLKNYTQDNDGMYR